MKLEIGMYCRYNNFQNKIKIAKIKEMQKADEVFQYDYINFDNDDGELETNIIKASYNIIDILEIWDFVSTTPGECALITGVYHDINGKKYIRLCNCIGDYYEDDIKSVITHEQMEQMAYKVEK